MNRPDRTFEAGSIVSSPPRVVNVMGFPAVFRRAKQAPGPLSDEGPTGRDFISSREGFPAPAPSGNGETRDASPIDRRDERYRAVSSTPKMVPPDGGLNHALSPRPKWSISQIMVGLPTFARASPPGTLASREGPCSSSRNPTIIRETDHQAQTHHAPREPALRASTRGAIRVARTTRPGSLLGPVWPQ